MSKIIHDFTMPGMPRVWAEDYCNPVPPEPRVTRVPVPEIAVSEFQPAAFVDDRPPAVSLRMRVRRWLWR